MSGGTAGDSVRLTFEQLRRGLVATDLITDVEIAEFLEFSANPTARYLPPFTVTAWGRRPTI